MKKGLVLEGGAMRGLFTAGRAGRYAGHSDPAQRQQQRQFGGGRGYAALAG